MIEHLAAIDFYRLAPLIYAVLWLLTTLSASCVKDGADKKSRSAFWLCFSIVHWGSGLIAFAMVWPH